jgi:ribonuclease T2
MRYLNIFLVASLSLAVARDLSAIKECEAYNNLRHTKNSHNVTLKVGNEYEILREQSGNYYIKVPNAKPQTRWVDKDCFGKSSAAKEMAQSQNIALKPKEKKKSLFSKIFGKKESSSKLATSSNSSLDSVLVLSWHNSFCENHSNKKECKRDGGEAKNHLVLHGLWPQPRGNSYCGVSKDIVSKDRAKMWSALPKLELDSSVRKMLAQYMPGSQSNLQRHEYYKHGSCYSKDANRYYKDALALTKEVDFALGEFFRANIGKKVKAIVAKRVATKMLDKDIKNKIAFKCKGRVLSEVWISLKGQGSKLKELIKNAKPIRSNCTEFIIDAPGRFRR